MGPLLDDRAQALYDPTRFRYLGSADIRPVVGGLGISILTTPKGLMSGRAARKSRIGGEILCEVW